MEQSDTIRVAATEKAGSTNTEPAITDDPKTELKILEIKLVKLKDTDITKSAATEDKETNKCSDDEGEDLPENFFDDFSNKDFMAGLDIVDDWIDDGTPYFADDTELKETAKPARKPSPARRSRRGAARSRRSRSHHRIRRSRSKERDAKHRTSRNRENHAKTEHKSAKDVSDKSKEHTESGRCKRSKDRKRSADKDAEGDDARRDPEKTKRDIQRDKIRFTKNLEQKVFIEQLKVAETGLVPPGTELDVVLETERKKKEEKKHEERKPETKRSVDDRKRTHGKSPLKKSKSKSRGREIRRNSRDRRERRRSRPLRSRSRSRRRSRESPRRRSRESPRRLSPIRRRLNRTRSRTFSPKPTKSRRSRSLEELYRRNDDLRLRIREKRRERYMNELSPVSEPRLSRSPTRQSPLSYASEREVWLRNKYRSRYGRSCSPISSSSMSDHGSPRRKRSKKSSFMEEIQRKLREQPGGDKATYDMFNNSFNNTPLLPLPVPAPAPTYPYMPNFQNNQIFPPAPQMCPNPYQPAALQPLMSQPCLPPPQMVPIPEQYGGPMMGGAPMGGMGPPQNVGSVMNMHQKQMQQPPKPVPPPFKMDAAQHTIQKVAKLYGKPDENKELTKLFEEQKISLSDYLSVSAKPIDPKAPINVHIKVKAISKCQELIRVINERSKHTGRFFPKMAAPISDKPTESLDIVKWKSPLRKVLPMRFNFTTQTKKSSSTPESKLLLINKLLAISGLPRIDDPQPSPTEEPSKALPVMPAPPRMQTPVKQLVPKTVPPAPKPPVLIKRSSIGVQTDPVKCQICELRKAMQFDDHACQTVPLASLDECTQVCVEDLNKSCVTFTPRGILKNSSLSVQSISHLTPAQLLQMQREKEDLDNPWGCTDPWTDSPYSTPRFADTDLRTQFKSSGLPGTTCTTSNESRAQFKPSGITGSTGFNTKDDPRAQFKSSLPVTSNFNANRNFPSPNTTSSTQFNKSSFSGGLLERPYSGASSFERGQDSYSAQERFGAYGSDRYSPEQNFNDSSNFMGGNSSRGRGGNVARGFTNSGPFNAPGRPFYGARGHN